MGLPRDWRDREEIGWEAVIGLGDGRHFPMRPLQKKALRRFAISFLEQKIQLAGSGISIHLFIPARLLTSEGVHSRSLALG